MKQLDKVAFTDLDAEREILALLMNHPSYTKDIQKIITPDVFHFGTTKAVYLTCVELFSEKGTFTQSDIIIRLKSKGSNDWVDVMMASTTRTPLNAQEVILYLAELKGKRDLLSLSRDVSNSLAMGQDYFSIVDKINGVTSHSYMPIGDEVLDIKKALSNAVNTLGEVMTNGSTPGVPTGYNILDNVTGGWMNGGVILFAARPGQGKTICLLEHTRKAAQLNKKVLFLSLEMPVESLIYRMISGQLDSGLSYSKINSGRITIEQFSEIQRKAVTELEKLPIKFYDGSNRDINYLSSLIQRIVREEKIDMVAIDYIQLCTDNQIKSSDETAVVGSVSKKVQQLAKLLKIPFLCAAQLNRQVEGRGSNRPKLSDLRSTSQLEQDASVVIGLYREDYYAYERAKENNDANVTFTNIIEYIFLKNRQGETKTAELYIDTATSKILESNPKFVPPVF